MEQKVFLVQEATGKKIPLADGKNTLGRGPLLGIEDKKLSRQQVDVTLGSDGSIKLLMTGTNPSFLRKVGEDEPILMKKGDEHDLQDGDVVSLLVHDYAFRLLIQRSEEKASGQKRKPEVEAKSTSDDSPPPSSQLKKLKSELPAATPSSKSGGSKLPVCMYGPGCYRKNPAHFQEYSHPWKDKPQAAGDNSDDEIMEVPKKPQPAAVSKPQAAPSTTSAAPAKPSISFSGNSNTAPKPNTTPSTSAAISVKPVIKPTAAAPAVSRPPAPAKSVARDDDDDEILEDAPAASQRIIAKPAAKFLLKMESDDEDDVEKPKSLDQAQKDNVTKLREQVATQSPKKAAPTPRVLGPGGRTLAFPPLSCTAGSFTNPAKAIEILLESVATFLKKNEKDKNLQLILVEPHETLLREIKQKSTLKDPRFIIRGGDITKLNNAGQLCKFIANPTNWRFKNGGVGVNKIVHDAAGPLLYEETKKRFQTAAIGTAYPVPLPSASPLHKDGQVDWVVHVNPPSMDKTRTDSITDLDEASAALKKCYISLFETFYELASLR